eukprot:m.6292 g.6292  ORF g.6292 m.6292 type:complete len:663 (+) comp2084_c0_seq1:66-2054(+)
MADLSVATLKLSEVPESFAFFATVLALKTNPVPFRAKYADLLGAMDGVRASNKQHEPEGVSTLWKACSSLPKSDRLYLPPFYGTKEAESVFQDLLRSLLSIDTKYNGRNYVLQGVIGVGKSLLLRAITIIGCLLLDVLVVFWDYQRESRGEPDHLATPAGLFKFILSANWENGVPAFPGWDVLSPPSQFTPQMDEGLPFAARGICICADEVNVLYTTSNNKRQVGIMSTLLALGKTPRTVVFISGSSSQLSERVFCSPDSCWAVAGYQNMNHRAFREINILPIRDLLQLKEYAHTRFSVQVDDFALAFTGGVGREVENWLESSELTTRTVLSNRIRKFVSTSSAATFFASYLLTPNMLHLDSEGKLLPASCGIIPSIPYPTALEKVHGITVQLLQQWEDESIILNRGSMIELLIPLSLEYIYEALHVNTHAAQIYALHVTLRGWSGMGSAVTTAEPLVLARFQKELDCAADGRVWELHVHDAVCCQDDVPLTPASLGALRGRLLRFRADKGGDAFMIDWDDADVHGKNSNSVMVELVVVQIKLGEKAAKSITAGVVETQLKNKGKGAEKKSRKSRVDDTTVAGIAVNLAHFAACVKGHLFNIFKNPKLHCEIADAILLTNKFMNQEARTLAVSADVASLLDDCALRIFDENEFNAKFADLYL